MHPEAQAIAAYAGLRTLMGTLVEKGVINYHDIADLLSALTKFCATRLGFSCQIRWKSSRDTACKSLEMRTEHPAPGDSQL
jgi:hypothetical protein